MKRLLFLLLSFFLYSNSNAYIKKPYNGKFIFAECNNTSYQYGLLELGYGYFKSQNKGYEFSGYLKLLDWYKFEPSITKGFGFKFNKFFRKQVGKKSSSIGYKFGLSYIKNSIQYDWAKYSKKDKIYFIDQTTLKSELFCVNIETFYNFRISNRMYLELGLGLYNGIEYICFDGGNTFEASSFNSAGASFRVLSPGYHYKTGFTGHIRLLGAFGKKKRK